jgi:hypothetical protein
MISGHGQPREGTPAVPTTVVLAAAGLAVAILAALILGGCSEADTPAQPATGTCVVTGRVGQLAPDPESAEIHFWGLPEGDYLLHVPLDASGHYRVEVPAGDYLVSASHLGRQIYLAAGATVTESSAEADTVRLGPENSPARIDIPVSALRVVTEVPPGMEGMEFRATLYRPSDWDTVPQWWGTAFVPDASGPIAIHADGLLPGRYKVKLQWLQASQWDGEGFWLPDGNDSAHGAWYRVGLDSLTTIPVTLPSSPARLTGSITGAWQAMGLYPPSFSAFDADSVLVFGPRGVEENGDFTLDLFRPLPVKLMITHNSVRHWIGGPDFASATLFDAGPGAVIQNIDVTLSGLILRIFSDMPDIAEYWTRIELRDPVDQRILVRGQGRFANQIGIACLQPGDYLLRLTQGSFGDRDWAPQWFDRAATPAEASLVTIPADGGVLTLAVVIERGGTISGSIVSAPDSLSLNAIIATTADEAVVLGSYWTVNSFSLTGLEDGSYKLGLVPDSGSGIGAGSAPPASTFWYPGTTDWAAATVFTISDGTVVTGLVFDVP